VNSNPKPATSPAGDARAGVRLAAKWITPDVQAQAIAAGYAVVDHTSVLAAHLAS
jgi:flagellar biosynthesis component FlhA